MQRGLHQEEGDPADGDDRDGDGDPAHRRILLRTLIGADQHIAGQHQRPRLSQQHTRETVRLMGRDLPGGEPVEDGDRRLQAHADDVRRSLPVAQVEEGDASGQDGIDDQGGRQGRRHQSVRLALGRLCSR